MHALEVMLFTLLATYEISNTRMIFSYMFTSVTYGRAFTLNFVRPGSDSHFYELGTLDTVGHPVVYTVKVRIIICQAQLTLSRPMSQTAHTVYPKKYEHGFCFAVLCCGYTLTDFPISIRLTSLALWQSDDCPSACKATLMNMDKYFIWIHYERLHNHNKANHNKTVCIFLGIYLTSLRGRECGYFLSRSDQWMNEWLTTNEYCLQN